MESKLLWRRDSPSSMKTKSSFFSRSANFGNVSPFRVGATNTFFEPIHLLIKLPNCVLKFYYFSKALGSFGLLALLGAGTGFVGVLPLSLIFDPPHSPSKSITECIKFTKSCDQIFDSSTTFLDPLVERNSLYGKRTVGFFSLASHALRAC